MLSVRRFSSYICQLFSLTPVSDQHTNCTDHLLLKDFTIKSRSSRILKVKDRKREFDQLLTTPTLPSSALSTTQCTELTCTFMCLLVPSPLLKFTNIKLPDFESVLMNETMVPALCSQSHLASVTAKDPIDVSFCHPQALLFAKDEKFRPPLRVPGRPPGNGLVKVSREQPDDQLH